ncbi:hypothetical protein BDP27DRAFT_1429721 [Rhodocollybia butyracea]|uniref:Uncharacterized protein n=1 Tax=Rhodocollybia butyracea TaxID=206335 RepID=A0A9P5TZU4_9AGAR|nr:hypothetical protein BDP27DRAFT_1429721 [Rhodocollybia butyracea]
MSSSQSLSDEALAAIESSLVFTYVMQVTVTVMIWDIVIHIGDDVELLSLPEDFGHQQSSIFYRVINRFLFLIYFCVVTTADTAPAACQSTLVLTSSATNFIAQVFTLFQFFLRVRVIYCEGSRLKTGLFATLWVLASGGASLSVDFLGRSACTSYDPMDTGFWIRMGLPIFMILVYDSCVFLAISYKIYKLSLLFTRSNPRFNRSGVENGCNVGRDRLVLMQSFKVQAQAFAGTELSSLTRAILHDGQFYYLISVAAGAMTLALLLNPSIFPTYRAILVPLHSVVLNITTGHVFREVKLGRMKERELTLPLAFQQSEVPVEGTLPLHPMHRDENAEESPS